jgi:cytochrome d ubiquinol oxidase subunit II
MKAEGRLQQQARSMAWWLGGATLTAILVVSLATPFLSKAYFDTWLRWPAILAVSPVPILVALASWAFVRSLRAGHEVAPFLLTLGVFLLCFLGLGISVFPDVVPGAVSIWDAATDRSSQIFMLWGTGLVLPMILAYTGWAYWVFRGKVRGEGYHA